MNDDMLKAAEGRARSHLDSERNARNRYFNFVTMVDIGELEALWLEYLRRRQDKFRHNMVGGNYDRGRI